MKKINGIFDDLIWVIYIVFICLFISSIFFKASLNYILLYICILAISIGIYFFIKKVRIKGKFKTISIVVLMLLSLLGIVARIYLANISYIEPYSDYATFYANSVYFSENFKFLNTNYIALFPYLTGYMMVLGLFFRIFTACYSNVVIFNLLIDICSAIVIFLTFRKKSISTALLFTTIWLINPINIIWCAFVYPMSITNFFVVLGLCLFEKFEKDSENKRKFLIYNVVLGCVLAIGSMFKPIFIIFIIAIFINRIYECVFKRDKNKVVILLSLLLLCCSYGLIRIGINKGVEKINGCEVSSTQGWTLYLGSNVESDGGWNELDAKYLSELLEKNSEVETQKILKDVAIQRYKDNGVASNLKLMRNKFIVLTSSLGAYSYEGFSYIQQGISNEIVMKLVKCSLFVACFMIVASSIYIVAFRKNIENKIMYMLLAIGLITAHFFVEVSVRYSIQAYIPMMMLSFIMINDLRNKVK